MVIGHTDMKFYAIYDSEETIAFLGDAKESSKFLGFTIDSFYCFVTRCRKNKKLMSRNGRYRAELVGNLDDD